MLAHIFSRRFQKASRPRRTHFLRTLRHPESLEGRALLATLGNGGSEWPVQPVIVATMAEHSSTFASGEWGWAGTLGEGSSVTAIDAGSDGNVVVSGIFNGTCDVDPGTGEFLLTSAGGSDGFVAKYTSTGELLWARPLGGIGDDRVFSIAIDPRDNSIALGGTFSGTVDFDPGVAVQARTSVGYFDAFLSKFNGDGAFEWVGTIGSNSAPTFGNGDAGEYVSGIDFCTDGNLYATGMFNGAATVSFGSETASLTAGGPQNTFILEASPAGGLVWAKQFTSTFLNAGSGISVMPSGRLAVRGFFHTLSGGPPDFDPGVGTAFGTAYGYADGYLAVLEGNGDYAWSATFGTPSEDATNAFAVGADGSLYVAGHFGSRWGGTIDLDPSAAVASFTAVGTEGDMYVVKLSPTGDYVWGQRIGGLGLDQGRAMAINPEGRLVIAGVFSGTTDFDPGVGQYLMKSVGGNDGFLLTLNPEDGTFDEARQYGGSGDENADAGGWSSGSMTFGAAGQGYTAGAMTGTVDFSNGAGSVALGASTGTSGFIWQFANGNAPPAGLKISTTSIPENNTIGAAVGTLAAFDADSGDTLTYSLVTGTGSDDNFSFKISGDQLLAVESFDYEKKSAYSIRVRATDTGGLFTEASFAIQVEDITSMLFWLSGGKIYRSNNGGQQPTVIMPGPQNAGGAITNVAVDHMHHRVYWSEISASPGNSQIYSSDLTGGDIRAIYTGNALGHVNYGLAVDGAAGYVFLHSHDPAPVSVGGPHYDGSIQRVEIATGAVTFLPQTVWYASLFIDLGTRSLYYTDQTGFSSGGPSIYALNGIKRSSYDGATVVSIPVTGEIPSGEITVDSQRDTVYYGTRAGTQTMGVYAASLSGGSATLLTETVSFIEGLAFDASTSTLYWADSDGIHRMPADGSKHELLFPTSLVGGFGGYTSGFDILEEHSPHRPTALSLSADTVVEKQPIGTVVGTFSTTDPDVDDSFTYTFVSGAGSTDNGLFTIVGNELRANAHLDYDATPRCSVRIRATDASGLYYEAALPITVAMTSYRFVTVGDPGNPNDAATGYGAVDYVYEIGKYEVTIGQYCDFLNSIAKSDPNRVFTQGGMEQNGNVRGIMRTGSDGSYQYHVVDNDGDSANRPIAYVSLFNAMRFANWMANGQPTGDQASTTTEDGAYNVVGLDSAVTARFVPLNSVNPNTGSAPVYALPTEDEWYKAAYYSPALNVGTGGYYPYATQSIVAPGNVIGSQPNQANYYRDGVLAVTQMPGDFYNGNVLTDVGAFSGSGSYYGTFDQNGNVLEWSESGWRGGFFGNDEEQLQSTTRFGFNALPTFVGFRLTRPVLRLGSVDVQLSSSAVAENQPVGTVVGTLSTTSPISSNSIYTLVAGDGATDNALFTIIGDTLQTKASFDFETQNSYSIRVRSTDGGGLYTERVFAISVTDGTEPPTVTSVSIAGGDGRFSHGIVMVSVVFSSPVFVYDAGGTPMLTLETGDVDRVIPYSRGSGSATLEFSYTIQSGDTTEDLDYVSSSALALNGGTIRDGFGVDADLTLPEPGAPGSIGANNEIAIDTTVPTITLSNLLSDAVSGAVGIIGIDLSEPLFGFDYFDDVELTRNGELLSLDGVSWTGSGLNYSFDPFWDYNALPGIYELRISAAAAGISDVAGNELVDDAVLSWVVGVPPTDIDLSPTMVGENLPVGTVVGLLSTADDDVGDSFTYALVAGDGADDNASFTIRDGELLTAKSFTAATQGTYSIRIESTDAAGFTVSKAFTITVVGKPGAPTGVTGTPAHGSVRLSWTAPVLDGGAPITDYVIEYKREGSATWSTFARDPSDATTAHVTGLANYARYVFRVSAVNVAGTGQASTISSIVMPLPLPGMPTGLTAVPGDGRVTLSWSAPPPSAGVPAVIDYVVQFSDNDGATWTTFNDGRSAATSATVTRLANGVSYVFRVQAVNSAGTGTASLPSAAVTPRRAPGSPTGVTATPGNASVTLSWVAPASSGGAVVTDYIVQYSTSGVSWTTFNDAVSATTSATVTGLVNGAAYMFRVSAVNAAGMGKPSLPSARVTPVTIPGTPTSVAATFTNGQVRVSWAAPAASGGTPITDFIVQWSTNSGETWTTLADGRSTVPSTTVTGLAYGSSYAFRVAAVNAVGTGAFSTASAAVRLETVPGAPTGVIATAGNGRATVAWTAPASTGGTPITDYLIQYSRNNGTTWTTFADGVSNATSATVTGLVNGAAYVFRVAAVNASGTSAFSIKSAAITPVSFTAAGVTLGAVEFGSTQLGYAFRQDSVVRQVTTSGRNVAAGFIGTGWTMRAVWESDTGYQAFWADRSGRHAVWTLDSSGRFVTTKVLTASQLATLETELKFDLNGNGKSG